MDLKKKGEIVLVLGVFLAIGMFIFFRETGTGITGLVISILPEMADSENIMNETIEINESNGLIAEPIIIENNSSGPPLEQEDDYSKPIEQNTGPSVQENIKIQGAASATSCGEVTSNLTLTSDVSSGGSCFNISANSVSINCAGKHVTYATDSAGGYGINDSSGFSDIVIRNCVIVEGSSGTSQHGIYLSNANTNSIINSTIITTGTSSHGIDFVGTSFNNTFLNNNINSTGVGSFEILDETVDTYLNYLIYNNSFGRLEWLDNGTGNFLRNMTLNLTNNVGISNNIIIGNNSLAVNVSAFFPLRINSSVNITLRNISLSRIDSIQRLNNFSAGYQDTSVNGINCTGCRTTGFANLDPRGISVSHFTDQNTWSFNATSLGSFSLQGIIGCRNLIGNLTLNEDVNVSQDRFFQEYSACFLITTTNTILNCNNHAIRGDLNFKAIETYLLTSSFTSYLRSDYSNVTIKNCVINNFEIGINRNETSSAGFSDFMALNNTLQNVSIGISHGEAINNTIYNATNVGILSQGPTVTGNYVHHSDRGLIVSTTPSVVGNSQFGNIISKNNLSYNREAFTAINLAGGVMVLERSNISENYISNNIIGVHICGIYSSNFQNEQLINNTYGIITNCTGIAYDNTFKDSLFLSNGVDVDTQSFGTNWNLTFVNTSYNRSRTNISASAFLFVKWYVDVNITDTNVMAINNATASAYDSQNSLVFTNQTNSNGISRLEVIEYFKTRGVNYILTPSTIEGNLLNYTYNSTTINLYNHSGAPILVNLTLQRFQCGLNLTTNLDLGSNHFCTGNGILIKKNGLRINGGGFNLTGPGSNLGVSITGYNKTRITNLGIANFSVGLYLENSIHGDYIKISIYNSTNGVVFNNSNNNSLYELGIQGIQQNNVLATVGNNNNSLINTTINIANVSATGNTTIFRRWYVLVNATFNNIIILPEATVSAYFNSSGQFDTSGTTQSNGIATLKIAELNVNSSGITYLTPNNITLSYNFLGANIINSTVINISLTNNTNLNLSLILNCTVPITNSSNHIGTNITFCPGTYTNNAGDSGVDRALINVTSDHVTITCINTIFDMGSASLLHGLRIDNRNDVTVNGCQFNNFYIGVRTLSSSQLNLNNITITSLSYALGLDGIQSTSSNNISISNATISQKGGNFLSIELSSSSNHTITKSQLSGSTGILLTDSGNNIISNNSFSGTSTALRVVDNDADGFQNNFIYYNVFQNVSVYYVDYNMYSSFNYILNTTNGNFTQGNTYDNYCDKGSDLNSDGYADNDSSATAEDWPFDSTVASGKILLRTFGDVIDNGPKITTCPSSTVFLSSSSSSSSSSGGSYPPPAPPHPPNTPPPQKKRGRTKPPPPTPTQTGGRTTPPLPPPPSEESYSASETSQFLERQVTTQDLLEKNIKVTVILENTGTKKMLLFPEIFQKIGDPFFIVTRKTLGFEGSLFTKLSALSYSRDPVAGRLLKATIVNPEQIILNPGEKIEKVIEIDEGLPIPREIKIQFTTLGETVFEEDVTVKQKAFSGTALDIDKEHQYLDIYAIIVPEELTTQLEQYYAGNPTGAAIALPAKKNFVGFAQQIMQQLTPDTKQNQYQLELGLYEPGSSEAFFTDLYGPYDLKENQTFIFAQQLKYNPQIYNGNYQLRTKIYRGSSLLVKNQFDVNLGEEKRGMLWQWIAVQSALVLVGAMVYMMIRKSRKGISQK